MLLAFHSAPCHPLHWAQQKVHRWSGLHSAWDPANISTFQYLTRISKSQDLNFSIKYLNFSKSRISTQYLTHSQYLKPVSHGKGSISRVSVSHAQYLKVYRPVYQIKSVMVRHTYMYLIKQYCQNTLVKPIGGTRSVETLFEYKTPAGGPHKHARVGVQLKWNPHCLQPPDRWKDTQNKTPKTPATQNSYGNNTVLPHVMLDHTRTRGSRFS